MQKRSWIQVLFVLLVSLSVSLVPMLTQAHEENEDRNKDIFRSYIEAINTHNLDAIGPMLTDDFINYRPGPALNKPAFLGVLNGAAMAWPGYTLTIDDLIAQSDWVAARLTLSGTFENPLPNPAGAIPPTHEPFSFLIYGFVHLTEDGKIDIYWSLNDQLDFLQDMGVIPRQPAPEAIETAMMADMNMSEADVDDETMEDANAETVRRAYEDLFNTQNDDLIGELYDSSYVSHDANGDTPGLDGLRASFDRFAGAMPDVQSAIEETVAEGDLVASLVTIKGTFTNDLMSAPGVTVPANNQPIQITAIAFHRLSDGKIVEDWILYDRLDFFQQLGILPRPDAPMAEATQAS
jgi:steroid delta-isomerase-like uncharacterized protein